MSSVGLAKIAAWMFCAVGGLAQSLTFSVPVTSGSIVPSGSTVLATVTLTDASPSANLGAIQWNLFGGVSLNPALGAASIAASKSIACAPTMCLAAGTGAPQRRVTSTSTVQSVEAGYGAGSLPFSAAYGSGVVAVIAVQMPIVAGGGGVPVRFSMTNIVGSDRNGSAVPIANTSTPVTVTVQ
jgi:hypothetical protein